MAKRNTNGGSAARNGNEKGNARPPLAIKPAGHAQGEVYALQCPVLRHAQQPRNALLADPQGTDARPLREKIENIPRASAKEQVDFDKKQAAGGMATEETCLELYRAWAKMKRFRLAL